MNTKIYVISFLLYVNPKIFNVMKKIFLLTMLLVTGITTVQAQLLKFGVKAGVNFTNLNGGPAGIDYKSLTNYHAGVAAEVKLVGNFSIQPELLYTTQGATAKFSDAVSDFKKKTAYISIPVMAKYYLISDILSIEAGPQFSFLTSEKNNVKIGDSKTFDFAVGGGLGLNITKSLFAQARYTIGLTDVQPNTDVKNSVFQLSVGYFF